MAVSLGTQPEAQSGFEAELHRLGRPDAQRLGICRIREIIDQAGIEIATYRRGHPILYAEAGHNRELEAGNGTLGDVGAIDISRTDTLLDLSADGDIGIRPPAVKQVQISPYGNSDIVELAVGVIVEDAVDKRGITRYEIAVIDTHTEGEKARDRKLQLYSERERQVIIWLFDWNRKP